MWHWKIETYSVAFKLPMAKGRWKETADSLAEEAFCVLIRGDKAQRQYPKGVLKSYLDKEEIRVPFLKLCMEFDDTPQLQFFRKGILLVVQRLGTTKVAKVAKIHRVTMYRMLSKDGNPSLKNLTQILTALGLRLWVLEEDFFERRKKVIRPKDVRTVWDFKVSSGRRVKTKRS